MIKLDFSKFSKAVKRPRVSGPKNEFVILVKDTIGVVCITRECTYFIEVGKDRYNIDPESSKTKGKTIVYEQRLIDSRRTKHIRLEQGRHECNHHHYLPYAAGCCVKGNVMKNEATGVVQFKIKKVFVDYDNEDATRAFHFYRDNYDIIFAIRQERIERLYE